MINLKFQNWEVNKGISMYIPHWAAVHFVDSAKHTKITVKRTHNNIKSNYKVLNKAF